LYITPRAVLVYQFGEEPVTKEIIVTDNRLHPATITSVDCPASFVAARLAKSEIDSEGVRHTQIHVTIKSVPIGVHNTLLKIRTDDPEFALLNVPVRVHRQPPMTGLPKTSAKDSSKLSNDKP